VNEISFEVRGLPVAQGSMRAFLVKGRPIITSTSKGLGAWRRLIADAAQASAPAELLEGPLAIDIRFLLPRPKSAPKTRRTLPDKRPDLDKLCRSVFDSITHVLIRDDAQIVLLVASKDYGTPGVQIRVREVRPQ
jgi:crossover junction endodeoxyribonuclease RusA